MDSVTHIVLGACMGKVLLPEKLGKKTLLLGALAHSIPDIDIVSTFFNSQTQDLILHRAISHSLFMALIFALLFTTFTYRYKRKIRFGRLFFPFMAMVVLHDLLDTCNNYGTELFAPFSSERFSFHLLYVADPLFTIVPLIAAILLFVKKTYWIKAKKAAILGIVAPCIYLGIVGFGKIKTAHILAQRPPVANARFDVLTPTPFNGFLWYGIFTTDSTVYTTYRSALDKAGFLSKYASFARNERLLKNYMDDQDTKNLLEFSQGIYTVEQKHDTILFNIPRFGQILGWEYPNASFTFYYYIHPDISNSLSIQRGRFKGWNRQTIRYFWNRILGNEEGE